MAFLEDLGKKAQDVAYVAGEKAQEVASVVSEKASNVADRAKAEYTIAAEKYNLGKHYRAIGEWYVSEIGEDVPEAIAETVSAVRASLAKIAELEAQRPAKVPAGEKLCPGCGKKVSTKFCPDCGAEIDAD